MKKRFVICLITLISLLTLLICGVCGCEKNNTPETKYFTVNFNLDGGSVADKDLSVGLKVKEGTTLILSEYEPTKEGCDFAGWKIEDTAYQSNDKITVTADITLIAQWTAIVVQSYKVTFDVNGGTMANANTQIEVKNNTVINFADYTPTLENYIFVGWKVADKVFASSENYTVTGAVTFVAQWRLKPIDADKFVFEDTQDGKGYILVGFKDDFDVENVIVPGEYNDKPIIEIKENVFFGTSSDALNSIKSVNLTNCTSLVKIGSGNFYMVDGLESVDVTGCTALIEIGSSCFNNCQNLTSVSLADCSALKTLGNSCFRTSPKLVTIDLKGLASLEEIGSGCFFGYSQFEVERYLPVASLDFTDCVSLKSIGQMSFWYLSEIKTLDFSKTKLSTVDRQVIMGCEKLEKVALPATLNPDTIANQTLGIKNLSEFIYECDNVKEITVDALSIYLCAENGVLYDIDKTTIFKYPANSDVTQYVAPSTVKTIMSRAFANAQNLTSIDFANCNLKEIAFAAFNGCTNATLTMPFDAFGYYLDGSEVTLGNNWNSGVKQINYGERYLYFDFSIDGITDGLKVVSQSITVNVSATYGDDAANIKVDLNGVEVVGTLGEYTLELTVGVNNVEITANFGDASETKTITVELVSSNPTIRSTIVDGTIYTGSSIEFDIYAKDASGGPLDKSHITIKTNWGYGLNDLTSMAYTMTDNGESIHVSIDFDMLWDWMYYEGGQFTLSLTVKDGDTSASIEYRIEHRQN